MKRLLIVMAFIASVFTSVNAQVIATENANALDNIYVQVTSGAMTPLDFKNVFPVNSVAGLVVGKDFTPVFGLNVEGLAMFNGRNFADAKTMVKATNVGLNGKTNLTNAFCGYKGTPRLFEVSLVGGLGWLHGWNTSDNYISSKTGFDFAFNLGKKKAHSIVLSPVVYWNLNKWNDIKFTKHGAQLALLASYVYHFKTSNGTHSFKTYDISMMEHEIMRLNAELEACNKRKNEVIEKVVTNTVVVDNRQIVVMFAYNSYELTDEAVKLLSTIKPGSDVDILGLASPEGTPEYNLTLSQKRADAVAEVLKKNGVNVKSAVGRGTLFGETTNRLAVVVILK